MSFMRSPGPQEAGTALSRAGGRWLQAGASPRRRHNFAGQQNWTGEQSDPARRARARMARVNESDSERPHRTCGPSGIFKGEWQ